jgi:soluble lytic murein transglycosylase
VKASLPLLIVVLLLASAPGAQQQGLSSSTGQLPAGVAILTPTSHPVIPPDLSQLWLAPERGAAASRSASRSALNSAARLTADGEYTKALGVATQSIAQQGALGQYAAYYAGVAQLRLDRAEAALATFRTLQQQKPVGYLAEAAVLGEAEALEALKKPSDAVRIYDRLLKGRLSDVESVYLKLGGAAKAAGDAQKAAEAFTHVLYEFPLGANAPLANSELSLLQVQRPIEPGSARFKLELGRAERLFGAKRYTEARGLFVDLREAASGDDRELVSLRIAECDYFLKKGRAALTALEPFTRDGVSRQGEALFFYALASRAAGDTPAFVDTLHRVATDFPEQTWAEDALDNLGTHYIRTNQDEQADAIFRELYRRYPRGTYSERAAWKAGWVAYRRGDHAYAARVFEQAASDFPRSDYRPAWLYWSGRANEQLGDRTAAQDRFLLTAADYLHSYYGRLASGRLDKAVVARVSARTFVDPKAGGAEALPPNGPVVRDLLDAEMYADALNELRYAQRVWGDSSAIQATVAWTRQQQARTERGMARLLTLRSAINTMRRAYPQFMAAGGQELPREVQTVIYPLAYWDLIRKHAEANRLDPFLVAALILQESTFVPDVRSGANAQGLMQLMAPTARQYARRLKIPYSSRLLTNPEMNIRMGTAYLADKIREFGDLHSALASYNAGERAVRRWQSEKPGIAADEFIDDIPYPETQHYVKKILGTAEDYRRLYGGSEAVADTIFTTSPVSAPSVGSPARSSSPARKVAPRRSAPRKPAARKPASRSRRGA